MNCFLKYFLIIFLLYLHILQNNFVFLQLSFYTISLKFLYWSYEQIIQEIIERELIWMMVLIKNCMFICLVLLRICSPENAVRINIDSEIRIDTERSNALIASDLFLPTFRISQRLNLSVFYSGWDFCLIKLTLGHKQMKKNLLKVCERMTKELSILYLLPQRASLGKLFVAWPNFVILLDIGFQLRYTKLFSRKGIKAVIFLYFKSLFTNQISKVTDPFFVLLFQT